MPSQYMTPGVYIQEKDAFLNKIVPVETAVPVFIGYTQYAVQNGKSILRKPTRITSFAEYVERFGQGFKTRFSVKQSGDKQYSATVIPNHTLYLFNSIRLFYANGGAVCYILSVGTYDGVSSVAVKISDFAGTPEHPGDIFDDLLATEPEPTMVVIPDAMAMADPADAYALYRRVLLHCAKVQTRIGIFDIGYAEQYNEQVINAFKDGIGNEFLSFGVAYYPWLKAGVVNGEELTFENLDSESFANLFTGDESKRLLTVPGVAEIIAGYVRDTVAPYEEAIARIKMYEQIEHGTRLADHHKKKTIIDDFPAKKAALQQQLLAASPSYTAIMKLIADKMNLLPPSGAMAGLYTMVDHTRGVWKSPANISVASITGPVLDISHDQQQNLNFDTLTGKSINVIRSFPGVGTLVWGGRTLDGNSADWRYINVRRTIIMIEQSVKRACLAYVFEPNEAKTWATVKNVTEDFLTGLWKEGALAGITPGQAFSVQTGLGETMTGKDILNGILRVSLQVAIVRPGEFITISFQQLQQRS